MLLNALGFIGDFVVIVLYGLLNLIAPKKFRPKIKKTVSRILAIEDSDDHENQCYAVQVFNFKSKTQN